MCMGVSKEKGIDIDCRCEGLSVAAARACNAFSRSRGFQEGRTLFMALHEDEKVSEIARQAQCLQVPIVYAVKGEEDLLVAMSPETFEGLLFSKANMQAG